ncbi:50S ribosomal protein L23, partial [Alistipes putredinis]
GGAWLMKTAHDIILKPVITENSMAGIADKKYTFKVATDATKVEIAQAVETLFPGAKVAKVNTISVRGRFRRQGMHAGYTAASKKAIVTLTKDSKEIEFFNSMV